MHGRVPSPSEGILVQVETDPIPHLMIDVRSADAIKAKPLPKELSLTSLHLPMEEIGGALAGEELK